MRRFVRAKEQKNSHACGAVAGPRTTTTTTLALSNTCNKGQTSYYYHYCYYYCEAQRIILYQHRLYCCCCCSPVRQLFSSERTIKRVSRPISVGTEPADARTVEQAKNNKKIFLLFYAGGGDSSVARAGRHEQKLAHQRKQANANKHGGRPGELASHRSARCGTSRAWPNLSARQPGSGLGLANPPHPTHTHAYTNYRIGECGHILHIASKN